MLIISLIYISELYKNLFTSEMILGRNGKCYMQEPKIIKIICKSYNSNI